jgi:hypothetical protein
VATGPVRELREISVRELIEIWVRELRVLGRNWLLAFPQNRLRGVVFGLIGCSVGGHVVARTQLKAPRGNVGIKRFLKATLISSFFEDAIYERMQAAEMARAQTVRRKSGGRNLVTARLIPPPYLAQRLSPKSKPATPPIELFPFVDPKPWLELVHRK